MQHNSTLKVRGLKELLTAMIVYRQGELLLCCWSMCLKAALLIWYSKSSWAKKRLYIFPSQLIDLLMSPTLYSPPSFSASFVLRRWEERQEMRAKRREGEGIRLVCLLGAGICLREAALCECLSLCFWEWRVRKKSLEFIFLTLSVQIRCWCWSYQNGSRNTLAHFIADAWILVICKDNQVQTLVSQTDSPAFKLCYWLSHLAGYSRLMLGFQNKTIKQNKIKICVYLSVKHLQ